MVKQFAGDYNEHKRIPIESIRACSIQNQEEQVASDGGSFKRSRSWLSKLRKEATENSTFTIMEGLDEAAKLKRAMGK